MSANNEAICPRCHKKWKELTSGYGEVPEKEYLARLKEPKKKEPQTLMEYFFVGMHEKGTFSVGYSCRCTKCEFAFKFNHKEEVPVEQTRKKGKP